MQLCSICNSYVKLPCRVIRLNPIVPLSHCPIPRCGKLRAGQMARPDLDWSWQPPPYGPKVPSWRSSDAAFKLGTFNPNMMNVNLTLNILKAGLLNQKERDSTSKNCSSSSDVHQTHRFSNVIHFWIAFKVLLVVEPCIEGDPSGHQWAWKTYSVHRSHDSGW